MKCEVCLELLEEYLDGQVPAAEQEQIGAHLIACADCATAFGTLTAEQELFARYDRELEVPPFLWTRVAEHWDANTSPRRGWRVLLRNIARPFHAPASAFAAAIAIPLIAIAIGIISYLAFPPPVKKNTIAARNKPQTIVQPNDPPAAPLPSEEPKVVAVKPRGKRTVKPINRARLDQSDVLSTDLGYMDIDDQDTAAHIEQTQNLLRSIRNVKVSDGDEEIDVSYDKALSRRLLNENVVLRRDAEMKAKFPTKTLLADLEPFLLDIANLPDHARPEDVRVIKERVQKTEIVAALVDYQDRGRNNR
jgi:Putative zinc-finger